MVNLAGPGETELRQDEFQNLEMVVLLIAHHVDVRIETVLLEAALGGAEVLRHIHGSAVRTEEEFTVEAVGGEVAPHAAVRILYENAHIKALLHEALAQQIGLGFVVHLVE